MRIGELPPPSRHPLSGVFLLSSRKMAVGTKTVSRVRQSPTGLRKITNEIGKRENKNSFLKTLVNFTPHFSLVLPLWRGFSFNKNRWNRKLNRGNWRLPPPTSSQPNRNSWASGNSDSWIHSRKPSHLGVTKQIWKRVSLLHFKFYLSWSGWSNAHFLWCLFFQNSEIVGVSWELLKFTALFH